MRIAKHKKQRTQLSELNYEDIYYSLIACQRSLEKVAAASENGIGLTKTPPLNISQLTH